MPLKIYLDLCRLRAGPQDLPASPALLAAALAAHFAADVATVLGVYPLWEALKGAAVDTALLAAVTHTALMLRNLDHRTVQTLSALAGCGAAIALLTDLAVTLLQGFVPVWAVWAPFVLWYLAVFGHIVRHAFSIPFFPAVGFALLYLILSAAITSAFLMPVEIGESAG